MDFVLDYLMGEAAKGLAYLAGSLAAWILTTSANICPTNGADPASWDPNWAQNCNSTASAAQSIQHLMLPLTGLTLTIGLIWQAIMMVVTRKGEPLLQAGRGLISTVLWGGLSLAVAHLLLKASDGFCVWVIDESIPGDGAPNEKLQHLLTSMVADSPEVTGMAGFFISVIMILFLIALVVMMTFRTAGVILLAGTTQFAAAGKTTGITSGWLNRNLSWSAALIAYKPAVVLIFAADAKLLQSDSGRDRFTGLAMLIVSIVAMPALMKFFTHFTGQMSSGGGGLATAASGGASALHAAASMRSLGGGSAAEHARYLDSNGPGKPAPSGAAPAPSPMPMSAGPAAGAAGAAGTAGARTAATTVAPAAAAGPAGATVAAGAMAVQAAGAAARSVGNTAQSATSPGGDR
ncbi:Collagen alpha-4(VI) chain [Actinoplanes sp. SE50]|uniref:hypothetical protein n=1 Tax=unclassified Actinoplanes TaxID=2626549 RepID=UPI00023EBC03|nr:MULTISPECIES: hypothetical protein [unclassified Actinoplanes]AEV86818.1 Collagen alpha-4(VI) chain [Actinoplanes sp. SE50/110]ATO85215.1 Collagen alpha-4(VI) chain [Actinoplanes sp. SE50]SLM02625.1 hypothetical protein ACSP50_5907 [Actinoplanes sp. SE50/110]